MAVKILRVVVASPSDVGAERNILPKVIEEVNRDVAADRDLRLELVTWDRDAYPGFAAGGPQVLIDPILGIPNCDILIGIYWTRFGTPTPHGETGSQHEIDLAIAARAQSTAKSKKPQVMVYFCNRPYNPGSVSVGYSLSCGIESL
jgi:hypothetical protein